MDSIYFLNDTPVFTRHCDTGICSVTWLSKLSCDLTILNQISLRILYFVQSYSSKLINQTLERTLWVEQKRSSVIYPFDDPAWLNSVNLFGHLQQWHHVSFLVSELQESRESSLERYSVLLKTCVVIESLLLFLDTGLRSGVGLCRTSLAAHMHAGNAGCFPPTMICKVQIQI